MGSLELLVRLQGGLLVSSAVVDCGASIATYSGCMPRSSRWLTAFAAVAAGVTACQTGSNQSGNVHAASIGALADIPAPRTQFDQSLLESCGQLDSPDAVGATELVRFPYLQQVSTDSAKVLWTSRTRGAHSVQVTRPNGTAVGTFGAVLDETAHPTGAFQYVADLTGLDAAEVYCYSLVREGLVLGGPLGFRTAPRPNDQAPVSFVAFGDSGLASVDQDAVFAQMQGVPFDLALGTGDMAYGSGTLEQLEQTFFAVYEPMLASIALYPTPGNHDYKTADAAPFREVFALPDNGGPSNAERRYSFDWGDVHFVSIDRQALNEEQAAWLAWDLERNDRPWTIVFTHQSPYSSGEHGSSMAFRQLFSPILEQHGVQLVLAGHDHDYERSEVINGVTYVVTGGGGRGTRPVGHSSFTAFSVAVMHFVYVRIEGQELRLYAIDATGQTFDFARIVNR